MPIIQLEDMADERLAPFVRLRDHQLRDRVDKGRNILVAESRFVLEVAVREGLAPLALLLDERHVPRMSDLIERVGSEVPVFVAPRAVLSELVGYNVTRGYYGAFARPTAPSVADVATDARLLVVLDGLVDATNVGAIFRSAAALGADAVLLSPTCADPFSRRALRVSMGTSLQIPWARIASEGPHAWPQGALRGLQRLGFHVAALALTDDATPLGDPRLASHDRICLVLGTEGWGLSPQVLSAVDEAVVIPMSGRVDSLNVGAAAAVALWELRRR